MKWQYLVVSIVVLGALYVGPKPNPKTLKDYCGGTSGAYTVSGEVRAARPVGYGRVQVTLVNHQQTNCPISVFMKMDDAERFRVGDVISFAVDKQGLGWTNIRDLKVNPVDGTKADGTPAGNWVTVRMSNRDLVTARDPKYLMVDLALDAYGYRYVTLVFDRKMARRMREEAVYTLYFGGDRKVHTIEKGERKDG